VAGVQLGGVNVAGEAEGFLFGLVNIADELDGEALGLFTWVGGGYRHVEAWVSDSAALNVGFKLGSRHLYAVGALGLDPFHATRLQAGGGIGGHLPFERLYVDIDALGLVTFRADAVADHGLDDLYLFRARVTVGYAFAEHFALFIGASLNVGHTHAAKPQTVSLLPVGDISDPAGDGVFKLWPGILAGIRL
jgi:hypothetical protein